MNWVWKQFFLDVVYHHVNRHRKWSVAMRVSLKCGKTQVLFLWVIFFVSKINWLTRLIFVGLNFPEIFESSQNYLKIQRKELSNVFHTSTYTQHHLVLTNLCLIWSYIWEFIFIYSNISQVVNIHTQNLRVPIGLSHDTSGFSTCLSNQLYPEDD